MIMVTKFVGGCVSSLGQEILIPNSPAAEGNKQNVRVN